MKEIGGYFELEKFELPMLYDKFIKLNCGRNCLAYLIKIKKISKIYLPFFLCNSVKDVCKSLHVEIVYYHINENFEPMNDQIEENEWIYIVNYYGVLSNEKLEMFHMKYKNIIVDNTQSYFQKPVYGVDTIYTCRKYFGVADGAILYTDSNTRLSIDRDESYQRMQFVLGRFERTASEFYDEASRNNDLFANEPVKEMSRLTENLLHAIDYEKVKSIRVQNIMALKKGLDKYNLLNTDRCKGLFMYPFMVESKEKIRKKVQEKNIYIPILWPELVGDDRLNIFERNMVNMVLPIPCDQRYDEEDMKILINEIIENKLG